MPQAQILIGSADSWRAGKFGTLNLLQLGSNFWLDQLQIIACGRRKTFKQRPVRIFPGIGGEVKFERGNLGGWTKSTTFQKLLFKVTVISFKFYNSFILCEKNCNRSIFYGV